jgi:hypothetical protein
LENVKIATLKKMPPLARASEGKAFGSRIMQKN